METRLRSEGDKDAVKPRRRSARVAPGVLLASAAWLALGSSSARARPPQPTQSARSSEARERTDTAKLVKGPYLTGLSNSGVDVRFELDVRAAATVEASASPDAGAARAVIEDRSASDMHVVHLSGLAPAGAYDYVVRVGGTAVGGGRFRTAPSPGAAEALRFVLYGDNRSDPTAHAAVVRALASSSADFLVNTGDMVEDGSRADDWQSFFDVESALLRDRPLLVAIGNHELISDAAGANFARYFGFAGAAAGPRPYGSLRVGNARFFFLSGMQGWASGEERLWLERTLGEADGEAGLVWRIVVVHHGPWSSGPHGSNAALLRAGIPELLVTHGVDAVVSGHDHIYERGESGALKYVISGGGGAPLYRIAKKTAVARKTEAAYHFVEVALQGHDLRLVARRVDGTLIDQCGFEKGKAWDCDPPPPVEAAKKPVTPPAAPPATVESNGRCSVSAAGGTRSGRWAFFAAVGAFTIPLLRRRRGGH